MTYPHSINKFQRVINIQIIENRISLMLQFYYIKIGHRFVSNHSKCLNCVCSKTHLIFKTFNSKNDFEKMEVVMKQVYPVLIAEYKKDFLVYVPDMDIYTEGKSMVDAIEMARDAIGLKGIAFEDDGKAIPLPSTREVAMNRAKEDADIFDYSTGILTLVDVDFYEYRRRVDNRAVRRNVTLPNWLNAEAEKAQLNVSRVLQDALISILGITRKY